MQAIKRKFAQYFDSHKEQVRHAVQGTDPVAGVEEVMENATSAWNAMMVRDAELKHIEGSDAYHKPARRSLGIRKDGTEAFAYDGLVTDVLASKFKYQPKVWADVESSPRRWKGRGLRTSGEYDPKWTLEDTSDGYEFGKFVTKLVWEKESAVPLVFILYYDGLEVCNGLGQSRGTHKLACFYWALVNINSVERFHHIHLATLSAWRRTSHFLPQELWSAVKLGRTWPRRRAGQPRCSVFAAASRFQPRRATCFL
jgi:hypothetical protein